MSHSLTVRMRVTPIIINFSDVNVTRLFGKNNERNVLYKVRKYRKAGVKEDILKWSSQLMRNGGGGGEGLETRFFLKSLLHLANTCITESRGFIFSG